MMKKLSVDFGLRVFSAAEQFPKSLQTKHFNAQVASFICMSTLEFLKSPAIQLCFYRVFPKLLIKSKDLTEPVFTWQRCIPRQFDDGSDNHQFTSVKDYKCLEN